MKEDNLFKFVGRRIRELRDRHGGDGMSQETLAAEMKVSPNTISRWETATYRPTIEDLDRLGRFFGVSVLDFFPPDDAQGDDRVAALLRTAKQLKPEDLEELQRYAEFRRARARFKKT